MADPLGLARISPSMRLVDSVSYAVSFVRQSFIYYYRSYSKLEKNHGPFHAFVLLFIFPDASSAMDSVRNNLFRASDHDVMLIKKSLADDCSMMAVAVRNSSSAIFREFLISS